MLLDYLHPRVRTLASVLEVAGDAAGVGLMVGAAVPNYTASGSYIAVIRAGSRLL